MQHRGPGSKAVVWAHNSHVGNAEFTEMGQVRGEHNIGQLARERFGDNAALDRLRHRSRHGRRRVRLGRPDGDQARAPGARGFLRGQLARRRHPGLLPRNRARSERDTSATPWPSRCSSAPSASSTGPRRSCCRIISRPNCRASSTPGSGSPRPGPWRRTRKPIRTAPTRPTPSGCSNIHSHSARTQKHSFTSGRLQ